MKGIPRCAVILLLFLLPVVILVSACGGGGGGGGSSTSTVDTSSVQVTINGIVGDPYQTAKAGLQINAPVTGIDEEARHAAFQTWTITWSGQTATISVDANGNFTGSGWVGTASGCGNYDIPISNGVMSGTSMTFTISASYCSGTGSITGSASGTLNSAFSGGSTATGTISGTISDALGARSFSNSWSATKTSGSTDTGTSTTTTSSERRMIPLCRSGSGMYSRCAPASNSYVQVVYPGTSGWRTFTATDPVQTDSSGEFSITIDVNSFISSIPYFIAVSDENGVYTQLSIIPRNEISGGATIELVVDRVTTSAAIMHCPGGRYPAPTGAYCYSDPNESTSVSRLYATLDVYFESNDTTTVSISALITSTLSDADVLEVLNDILQSLGLSSVTSNDVSDMHSNGYEVPLITAEGAVPITGTGISVDNTTTTTTDTGGGGGSDTTPSQASVSVEGAWSGTYSRTSTGDGGCTYSSSGTLEMTVTDSGGEFSGSAYENGIQLRLVPSCAHYSYTTSTGTVTGTLSGEELSGTFSMPISETGGTQTQSWTGTISGDTITGEFAGTGSGSFTLTR